MKIDIPKAEVAIIVPCYNHGLYLSKCLESIIEQIFTDWVCIVIDDGSTDNSEVIAKHFSNICHKIYYVKQNNLGVAYARNKGINISLSDFILPLDSDDIIMPQYLEKTVNVAKNNPKVKVVYTNCSLFGRVDGLFTLPEYSFQTLLQRNIITSTALFRREDYNKTSGYDTGIQGWEDWDFWISLLDRDSQVIKLSEALFWYRQYEESRNSKIATNPKLKSELRQYIYYKHIEKYQSCSGDPNVIHFGLAVMKNELKEIAILHSEAKCYDNNIQPSNKISWCNILSVNSS